MKVYQVSNIKNHAYNERVTNSSANKSSNNQTLAQITSDTLNRNPIAYLNKTLISFSRNNDINKDVRPIYGPANYIPILSAVGIKVKEDDDGMLILSHYDSEKVNKFGIFETALFENIKEIKGNAKFTTSGMYSLGSLEKIGGNATFAFSTIKSLGNLREIGGDAYFCSPKLKTLGKLEKVGNYASFSWSKLRSTGRLKEIGGNVCLGNSNLTPENFKNIKVGGEVFKFYRNDC